ncbi:MAG: outer membrane protein assembly factor BamC [Burkholderiales bacterium]|nr:outer membrane protein assembly factor BamC [Burkholderiales bacterium]
MIRNTRFITATAATLLLAGCANTTFHIPFMGHDDDANTPYGKSRENVKNKPLDVPPDLNSPEVSGAYAIPGMANAKLTPSGQKLIESQAVLPKFDKVRMESAGGQRWLVVGATPEAVWTEARQFWLDQGFALTVDNPTAGLIETNWREERPDLPVGGFRAALQRGLGTLYSTGRTDQYRMRLERGSEAGTTEIYISHRGMEEVFTEKDKSDTRWTERKPEPEREAEELKMLLVRLGVTADVAGQVVATASKTPDATATTAAPSAPARATLVSQADGKHVVQVTESFDRAWRRVGLALERAGYGINDRDRSLGVYYVRPSGADKPKEDSSSSFLSKLEFWKSADEKHAEKLEPTGPEYLVVVAGKDEVTTIRVGNRDGSQLAEATASTLLNALVTELR